jgi:hypothetical protein
MKKRWNHLFAARIGGAWLGLASALTALAAEQRFDQPVQHDADDGRRQDASGQDDTALGDAKPNNGAVERNRGLRLDGGNTAKAKDGEKPTGYYREPGSYGTLRESDPPKYVRSLNKTGIDAFKNIDWLDVGLDYRFRYERRDDDFRRPRDGLDEPILLRTRAYLGLKEILDPFRFVIEFEDSRRYNSQYVRDDRDVNEFELIQTFGELYFKDALGQDDLGQNRPLRIRGGRMAFEVLDRRLIARNEWRNTTNNFQGFRIMMGEDRNDWGVDLLALQPIERLKYEFDRPNAEQWFFGAIGHWRKWSDIVTLEPYYLGLKQDGKAGNIDRAIHSTALRAYGFIGDTGFNYDFDIVYQFGRNGTEQHEAFGFTSEVGYTFHHPWKPRLSAFYGYGSGDHDPNDNKNQHFERFFGFARPWSNNDYFSWENLATPKIRLEFQPLKDLRIDTGYSWYWLASDKDQWANAKLRDPTGRSGDFIGHEFDIRVRYKLTSRIDSNIGYAHFLPGEFPKHFQRKDDSDFFYVELLINAFE